MFLLNIKKFRGLDIHPIRGYASNFRSGIKELISLRDGCPLTLQCWHNVSCNISDQKMHNQLYDIIMSDNASSNGVYLVQGFYPPPPPPPPTPLVNLSQMDRF